MSKKKRAKRTNKAPAPSKKAHKKRAKRSTPKPPAPAPKAHHRSHAVAKKKKSKGGSGRGKRSFNLSRPGFMRSELFEQGAAVTVGAVVTELLVWGVRKMLPKVNFVQGTWGGLVISTAGGLAIGWGAYKFSKKYGTSVALGCIGSSGTRGFNAVRSMVADKVNKVKALPAGKGVAGDAEGVNGDDGMGGRYLAEDNGMGGRYRDEDSGMGSTRIRTTDGSYIEV